MRRSTLMTATLAAALATVSSLSAQDQLNAQLDGNATASVASDEKQDAQSVLNTTPQTELKADGEAGASVGANPAAQLEANSTATVNAQASTATQNEDWRYRDYNGQRWYWQGDHATGNWSYWSNNSWVPYRSGNSSGAQVGANAQVGSRAQGYRGTTDANLNYHGPYYFDGDGRRYTPQGNSYIPDQNWNNRVWNDNYGSSYRSDLNSNVYLNSNGILNSNGSANANGAYYGGANANANVGSAVGQAIGGQSGAQLGAGVGAAIQGGPAASVNVGGAVGQAIGGQSGAQIGAGIGAAIGQGR